MNAPHRCVIAEEKPRPLVSVVIPVLNSENEVEPCIEALSRQDYPAERLEIVVVDNGSSDGTIRELERLGVKHYVRHERGRAKALNTGLEHAKGDIICSTDMSCRAEPQWISEIVRSFENSAVGSVAGEIKLRREGHNPVIAFQDRCNYMSPLHAQNRSKPPFLPYADGANASFRRRVFEEIGPFDETFSKGADVEICYRMLLLSGYKIAFNAKAVVWEPGEATLGALLKQRFRMGSGSNLMKMKYPRLYRGAAPGWSLRRCYWTIRGACVGAGDSLDALLRLIASNGKDPSAYDVLIKGLMSVSQRVGGIYGRLLLWARPIAPVPVDSAKIDEFLQLQREFVDRMLVRSEA